MLRDVDDRLRLADAVDACIVLAWTESDPIRALRLAGAGDAFRTAAGLPRTPADERRLESLTQRIRLSLGESEQEAAARAVSAGRALSADEAIAETCSWLEEE